MNLWHDVVTPVPGRERAAELSAGGVEPGLALLDSRLSLSLSLSLPLSLSFSLFGVVTPFLGRKRAAELSSGGVDVDCALLYESV